MTTDNHTPVPLISPATPFPRERTLAIFASANRSATSREVKCHVTHVMRVLDGTNAPSLPLAKKMADSLALTLDEFHDAWEYLYNKRRNKAKDAA